MAEFNDRMSIQRELVQMVNRGTRGSEMLYGLSSNAIERWLSANSIERTSAISQLLKDVSSKLFFLAAKSQEHISEESLVMAGEIEHLKSEIQHALLARVATGMNEIEVA
jgi:hypothetical protein